MANIKLRDRDAIQTAEGLIFRVFGYSHPPDAYICDAEYASQKSSNQPTQEHHEQAPNQTFYKFYNDEGMKLIAKQFQKYTIFHEMLRQKIVGINQEDITTDAKAPRTPARTISNTPTQTIS